MVGEWQREEGFDGRLMLKNFLDSVEESMEIDYDVVIVDNVSSNLVDNIDIPLKYNYIYNDDDTFGLTRGWNLCVYNFGYMNGNDFIFVCNDDLTFNKTINDFFIDVSDGFDLKNTLFGVTAIISKQHNQSFHKKEDFI